MPVAGRDGWPILRCSARRLWLAAAWLRWSACAGRELLKSAQSAVREQDSQLWVFYGVLPCGVPIQSH